LAVVYLGLTGDPAAVPPLCDALDDETVSVRRTAGDALSDLADPRAIGPMAKALQDPNKLVRWRAARFLYETGDESALAALHAVAEDPEFEVRMQIRLAIERIESGDSGEGPIWQQMTR
jgi:HEAT repeat protein